MGTEQVKTRVLSSRIPEDLYIRAHVYAARNDMKFQDLTQVMVTEFLNRHDNEPLKKRK